MPSNISCLVTAYSGENAKQKYLGKNSQICHHFWATLSKGKFARAFKTLPKGKNVAKSCHRPSHILAKIQETLFFGKLDI
jgi:hypothetical protein